MKVPAAFVLAFVVCWITTVSHAQQRSGIDLSHETLQSLFDRITAGDFSGAANMSTQTRIPIVLGDQDIDKKIIFSHLKSCKFKSAAQQPNVQSEPNLIIMAIIWSCPKPILSKNIAVKKTKKWEFSLLTYIKENQVIYSIIENPRGRLNG